jgi:starch-binding outer membrane protein, SusD/RagB family
MRYKHILKTYCILIFLLCLFSCKKYLETKSVQTLSTPQTLDDLQAILQTPDLNTAMRLNNTGTDEYYLLYNDWLGRPEIDKEGHVWDAQLNDGEDWNQQYITVFYANTVLFNLEHISPNGQLQKWNTIKGASLFFRAYSFFQLAQLYAPQYDPATAHTDLGIPLRLSADFNQPSTRSTVEQTYNRVIQDLQDALDLLPDVLPQSKISKIQPSRTACYALLARTYLQMGNYAKAKENADACLNLYNVLLDFNDPDWIPNPSSTIVPFNPEMIFYTSTGSPVNANIRAKIDSNLYKSFDVNDWRKTVFFRLNSDGISYRFKGSYNGVASDLFNGLATDEIYLIRAECYAREGNTMAAIKDLNDLLRTRWKKVSGVSTYIDQTAVDANDALAKIVAERKKEMIDRGIRWSDLKRLNKDSRFAITLRRTLNGQIYSLTPNDLRYTLLIPSEVIDLTKLQQNPR